jgi:hypothetical protein
LKLTPKNQKGISLNDELFTRFRLAEVGVTGGRRHGSKGSRLLAASENISTCSTELSEDNGLYILHNALFFLASSGMAPMLPVSMPHDVVRGLKKKIRH